MKGMYLSQEGHIVNALPPVDVNGGANSDVFHMKRHSHATILVALGVSAAALNSITVKKCTNAAGDNAEAIGFKYHAEETAAGDTLGAKQTATASGITAPTANDNTMYVIELDDTDLDDDKPYVRVDLANDSGNSVIASILAVLTGSRYAEDQNATVIT